jgi:hypothetical protein
VDFSAELSFKKPLSDAMLAAGCRVSSPAHAYVVSVLENFIDRMPARYPATEAARGTVVAVKYAADSALFIGGVFPESLERRGLGRGYAVAVASSGYSSLGKRLCSDTLSELGSVADLVMRALSLLLSVMKRGGLDGVPNWAMSGYLLA